MVIVVAKLAETGEGAYEARVRDYMGDGSELIPGIPVVSGTTVEEVVHRVASYIRPSEGRVSVVIREDPALKE